MGWRAASSSTEPLAAHRSKITTSSVCIRSIGAVRALPHLQMTTAMHFPDLLQSDEVFMSCVSKCVYTVPPSLKNHECGFCLRAQCLQNQRGYDSVKHHLCVCLVAAQLKGKQKDEIRCTLSQDYKFTLQMNTSPHITYPWFITGPKLVRDSMACVIQV